MNVHKIFNTKRADYFTVGLRPCPNCKFVTALNHMHLCRFTKEELVSWLGWGWTDTHPQHPVYRFLDTIDSTFKCI